MNIVRKTIEELKQQYFADERPWVVTYSGGKDSTCVLQLVLTMLQELHAEGKDNKHTYVVSSDTTVEMPIIEKYIKTKLEEIDKFAKTTNLKLSAHKLSPKVEESFWTLLLGKGYPSPTSSFRWCTERMKINPATLFLQNLVQEHQSIIMLLGVRSAESQARKNSIESRELNQRGLNPHDSLPNAYTLSPIKDWSNEDVWAYLSENPLPWGDHSYMMSLYDKGSGEGDCNIALNPESPSCGKTRFGCWVCTVVEKDRSLEGMLKNGEEWMASLWEYREMLYYYRKPESGKRDKRRRDGSVGDGPFLMEVRRELLEKLLETEQKLTSEYHALKKGASDYNPDEVYHLIKDDEIHLVQQNWNEDGDIENSAYRIAQKFGRLMGDRSLPLYVQSLKVWVKNSISICLNVFMRLKRIEKISLHVMG